MNWIISSCYNLFFFPVLPSSACCFSVQLCCHDFCFFSSSFYICWFPKLCKQIRWWLHRREKFKECIFPSTYSVCFHQEQPERSLCLSACLCHKSLQSRTSFWKTFTCNSVARLFLAIIWFAGHSQSRTNSELGSTNKPLQRGSQRPFMYIYASKTTSLRIWISFSTGTEELPVTGNLTRCKC